MYRILKCFTLALAALLLTLLLVGCDHKINNGKIVGKFFNNDYSTTTIIPVTCGKSIIMMPHTTYYDYCWTFKVEGITEEGETVVETFEVTQECWNRYLFGQYIDFEGERCGANEALC